MFQFPKIVIQMFVLSQAAIHNYSTTLGGSEKHTWPILLICIVDKSLCEACLVSLEFIYLKNFSFIPVVQET